MKPKNKSVFKALFSRIFPAKVTTFLLGLFFFQANVYSIDTINLIEPGLNTILRCTTCDLPYPISREQIVELQGQETFCCPTCGNGALYYLSYTSGESVTTETERQAITSETAVETQAMAPAKTDILTFTFPIRGQLSNTDPWAGNQIFSPIVALNGLELLGGMDRETIEEYSSLELPNRSNIADMTRESAGFTVSHRDADYLNTEPDPEVPEQIPNFLRESFPNTASPVISDDDILHTATPGLHSVITFDAQWAFPNIHISRNTFGDTENVRFMEAMGVPVQYSLQAENVNATRVPQRSWQMVAFPHHQGSELRVVAILPPYRTGVSALNAEIVRNLLDSLEETTMTIAMPSFQVSSSGILPLTESFPGELFKSGQATSTAGEATAGSVVVSQSIVLRVQEEASLASCQRRQPHYSAEKKIHFNRGFALLIIDKKGMIYAFADITDSSVMDVLQQ
ncbi:serpin family protein [Endozoicomonas euniceicola]|uniref:Serpin domain-containing protein n=1 Tax=Endozoicomonas euniceicola TaxID=1234143 RepID=A0ABY6H047_9GAMM|nr:serpin family protein [Endozoicomonas euniceicola]UYM18425.1 hypothetical protein NX720_11155 [Endozoicomonas euniceicola]